MVFPGPDRTRVNVLPVQPPDELPTAISGRSCARIFPSSPLSARDTDRPRLLIGIGIVIASIAAESGILQRMGLVAAPCLISELQEPAMVPVMTMFVDVTAGKARFAGLYRKGKNGREELVPSPAMGTFPVVPGESILLVHLPTAVLLMGPVVGGCTCS